MQQVMLTLDNQNQKLKKAQYCDGVESIDILACIFSSLSPVISAGEKGVQSMTSQLLLKTG